MKEGKQKFSYHIVVSNCILRKQDIMTMAAWAKKHHQTLDVDPSVYTNKRLMKFINCCKDGEKKDRIQVYIQGPEELVHHSITTGCQGLKTTADSASFQRFHESVHVTLAGGMK